MRGHRAGVVELVPGWLLLVLLPLVPPLVPPRAQARWGEWAGVLLAAGWAQVHRCRFGRAA